MFQFSFSKRSEVRPIAAGPPALSFSPRFARPPSLLPSERTPARDVYVIPADRLFCALGGLL